MNRQPCTRNFTGNRNARKFVKELAKRTRMMRDIILTKELEKVDDNNVNSIHGFYRAFKNCLIRDLSKEEFADFYSRTLTFGLLTASIHCQSAYDLKTFIKHIPHANGILRDVFDFVIDSPNSSVLNNSIEHIADLIRSPGTARVLKEYSLNNNGGDPIHHFYETFLSEYDPRLREKMGVYYTPGPVASFIARSIHIILKKKLYRPNGLADLSIKVLDPAAGTGAFLVEVARLAAEEFVEKWGEETREAFLHDYFLNNLYGFELMMAPYAVAYLKMGYLLEKMGGVKKEADRGFNIYLTDTLEMKDIDQADVPGMASLYEESKLAGKIKKDNLVTVILGNPPYSGRFPVNNGSGKVSTYSAVSNNNVVHNSHSHESGLLTVQSHGNNLESWIDKMLEDYKQVDGKPLGEKNTRWLQDDYVKFIRFAQSKIDETGEGVVGYITNNGYLDNPTFRGMRRSLMTSFDRIYILDLHGNALNRVQPPDGSRDDNVFDIRVGTAIAFFIKINSGPGKKECRVFYADLKGMREYKYQQLERNDIGTIDWQEIFPKPGFYLFKPRKENKTIHSGTGAYDHFIKITNIFPVHSVGIVTARDKLTIKNTPEEVFQTVTAFSKASEEEAREIYNLGDDTRDWTVSKARKDLIDSELKLNCVVPILYRPFDIRYTYYTGRSRGFLCMPRPEVMQHMLRGNVGLITVRQVAEGVFNHCLVSDAIVDGRITGSNKGMGYLFPLYIYPCPDPANGKKGLLGEAIRSQANINPRIFESLNKKSGFNPVPVPGQVFYYVYGILYSNLYREAYAEELSIDFPRVPFTPDCALFFDMAKIGERLTAIHLLKSPELNHCFSNFAGNGIGKVTNVSYDKSKNRIYINDSQYFSCITPDVWQYRVCGYRVMAKWLKSRKGESLNAVEIDHYRKIARIIRLTLQYQEQIDRLYPAIEKSLIVI